MDQCYWAALRPLQGDRVAGDRAHGHHGAGDGISLPVGELQQQAGRLRGLGLGDGRLGQLPPLLHREGARRICAQHAQHDLVGPGALVLHDPRGTASRSPQATTTPMGPSASFAMWVSPRAPAFCEFVWMVT
jgi:hypothetical protein